jgi:hypothetical protein
VKCLDYHLDIRWMELNNMMKPRQEFAPGISRIGLQVVQETEHNVSRLAVWQYNNSSISNHPHNLCSSLLFLATNTYKFNKRGRTLRLKRSNMPYLKWYYQLCRNGASQPNPKRVWHSSRCLVWDLPRADHYIKRQTYQLPLRARTKHPN